MPARKKRDAATGVISEMMAMRSFTHLMHSGGVQHWERVSVAVATEQVLTTTRQAWLRTLERWSAAWYERFMRKKPRDRDFTEITIINSEIKRLRRALGIRPTAAAVREQTRRRTAAWRERRKAAA